MDIVGIPMGNNCAPLVADLFLFCYERDFTLFLSDNSQADTIIIVLICYVCSHVDDFNNRNNFLTSKLLQQVYRYHKLRKDFSKFYYRHSELIVKYNICLKALLKQGISEPVFYGDFVIKLK